MEMSASWSRLAVAIPQQCIQPKPGNLPGRWNMWAWAGRTSGRSGAPCRKKAALAGLQVVACRAGTGGGAVHVVGLGSQAQGTPV